MEISVIIAYYDNIPNLEILLAAFQGQSFKNFEIIIAEDDHNPKTETFLAKQKDRCSFPIQHVKQEEKIGFRKCSMLNKAVRISRGGTLVFIDADCVPHPEFLKEYSKNTKPGTFHFGRRVLLGQKVTENIYRDKTLSPLRFPSLVLSDSKLLKEGIYWPWFDLHFKERKLSGCNWGLKKEDLIRVNGFDEDYVRPGVGEDHDIEWRLKLKGLHMESIKNKAIVYHLYHPKNSTQDDARFNDALMDKKKQEGHAACINGLEKLNPGA